MREFHDLIYIFEIRMTTRLCEVQTFDLSGLWEEMPTLHAEVRSLAQSYVPVIPAVITSFTQPLPLPPPMIFDLFHDEDMDSIVWTKRGRETKL